MHRSYPHILPICIPWPLSVFLPMESHSSESLSAELTSLSPSYGRTSWSQTLQYQTFRWQFSGGLFCCCIFSLKLNIAFLSLLSVRMQESGVWLVASIIKLKGPPRNAATVGERSHSPASSTNQQWKQPCFNICWTLEQHAKSTLPQ